jgi:hypothetical protein
MAFKGLDPKKTLLFDIEAGGLSGYKSSLLSVAFQNLESGRGEELFASPEPGSFISRWSETQVWERIKKQGNIQKEREILDKFLGVLTKHAETPGATIAGWNIGVAPFPQNPEESRMRGFDIPFLMTRAKRHGLEDPFRKIFQKLSIRDVGQEWAARISQIVSKPQYEAMVDPDIYEQAKGFRKALGAVGLENADIQAQARYASSSGVKLAGWKQESISQLMGHGKYEAHMAGEDVSALRKMLLTDQPIAKEAEAGFVQHWNRLALTNKLLATARYGGKSLEEIQQYAGSAGLNVGELTAKIEDLAKASGASLEDVGMGRGMPEIWSKVGERGIAARPAASRVGALAKEVGTHLLDHKVGYGILAGAALLYAMQPGGWFSGKDDNYNTIEGLPHGGFSERMRRTLTDFGSGWQGIAKSVYMAADEPIAYYIAGHWQTYQPYVSTLFSAKDDEYNSIEGMPHGWYGRQRRFNTDFGSGWDALRGLMRAGETFSEMLAGKEFQGALLSATKTKTLGKGAYGEVMQMTGQFREQTFSFARKQALPGQALKMEEVNIMRELEERGFRNAPSVYGVRQTPTGHQLDLELFEGHTLEQLGPESAELFKNKTLKTLAEMHTKGVEHMDPHLGNVMLVSTPAGKGEVGILDFGFARRFADVPLEEQSAFGKYDIGFFPAFLKARQEGKVFEEAYGMAAKAGIRSSAVPMAAHEFKVLTEGIVQSSKNIPGQGPLPKIQEAFGEFTGMPHTSPMTVAARREKGFKSKWIRKAISLGVGQDTIKEAARRAGKTVMESESGEAFAIGKYLSGAPEGAATAISVKPTLIGNEERIIRANVARAQSLKTGKGAIYKHTPHALEDPELIGDFIPRAADPEGGIPHLVQGRMFLKAMSKEAQGFTAGRRADLYEMAMQQRAHKFFPEDVPAVLGAAKNRGFFQEMAGRAVRPSEMREASEYLRTKLPEMAELAQVHHLDPSVSNLVRTKEGGFKVIDWQMSIDQVGLSHNPYVRHDVERMSQLWMNRAADHAERQYSKFLKGQEEVSRVKFKGMADGLENQAIKKHERAKANRDTAKQVFNNARSGHNHARGKKY